ncbi:dihydroorotase, multifunctional complex type [Desulfurococcus mucosus DSM 2162]|uniref:Dihydroorotase, multifunctional complex type n=2 Tax=Desulfurococcus mucosus TaxID=2275 RepID=E8R8L8_DESM0|nr:dihydroorotase, multifunctional complex type [Desulfurococcus mucosus DSM 2162]
MSLLVRNGLVVTSKGVLRADVRIQDGVITSVGRHLDSSGVDEVIDASGMLVFPGVIDEHVHMREPGLEYKDDFTHGSRAALKGGVTTVVEHPNTLPPVDEPGKLVAKARLLEQKAYVDFALLGVLHDGNTHLFEDMLAEGAAGFKVFMGPTTGNIPPPSEPSLYEVLRESGRMGVTVAFHAEDHALVTYFTEKARSTGGMDPALHDDARPPLVEEYSVVKIAAIAKHTGGRPLIVHISSAQALEAVSQAKRAGVEIYGETCPHYLLLDKPDYARYGSLIKVNPPIRGGVHRARLVEAVAKGGVDTVGSDHAPHAPEEKRRDIWSAASGMPGVQTLLPSMLDLALRNIIPLTRIPLLLAENPAKLWGLWPRKGFIDVGFDGDLVIVDPGSETLVTEEWLEYKYKLTPFTGWRFKGRVRHVVIRGRVALRDGVITGEQKGVWVKPIRIPGYSS